LTSCSTWVLHFLSQIRSCSRCNRSWSTILNIALEFLLLLLH
jgi:hypothetical protein